MALVTARDHRRDAEIALGLVTATAPTADGRIAWIAGACGYTRDDLIALIPLLQACVRDRALDTPPTSEI